MHRKLKVRDVLLSIHCHFSQRRFDREFDPIVLAKIRNNQAEDDSHP